MEPLTVVSLVTRNYVHYAHALAVSVKKNAPGTKVVVCLADDPAPGFKPPVEWDHWFSARELKIPRWRRFAFQYTPFELSCALKPFVMQAAMDQGFKRLAYLDGDMQVYSPMEELRGWLESAAIVLTPHARWSKLDPNCDFENVFLTAGAFNAGFFGLSDTAEARRFLTWWQAKMMRLGIDDSPCGLFVDQKWLDLVPGMFADVLISKHCGYNVGHWTLAYSPQVTAQSGSVYINGDQLAIFHYSGFQAEFPEIISRYEKSTVADFPPLAPLCQEYARLLKQCGLSHYSSHQCEFAALSDGTSISPQWREAIRSNHPHFKNIDDPFDVAAQENLVERFKRIAPNMADVRKSWRLARNKHPTATVVEPSRLKTFGKGIEGSVRNVRKRGKAAVARLKMLLRQKPENDVRHKQAG